MTLSVRAVSLDDGATVDATNLAPLETVKLVATTKPAIERPLRFALVDDALDAVLSETNVSTSPLDGVGETLLTAPSGPTRFRVRVATTDADTYYLDVAVPSTGIAKLQVKLGYEGRRTIAEYTATAWENTTCDDLPGAPPDDGQVTVTSTSWPLSLEVTAGVPLAVIVRAGRYIWGCTSVDAATEGVVKEVGVVLTDVPIKLNASSVQFTLSLDREEQKPFRDALVPSRDALLAALVGNSTDDIDALLDAMQATLSDPSSFSSTRRAETWDSVLRDALPNASVALRSNLGSWIQSGVDGLDWEHALVGDLAGAVVEGSSTESAPPTFTLDSAFGLSPALSTFAPSGSTLWNAQADDTVLIGVGLAFDPIGFQLGAAKGPAEDAVSDASDLAAALATALPCATVAKTLVAHGDSSKTSYEGCNETCTKQLCEAGVRALYGRASASPKERANLAIGVSGAGGVGFDANLTALSGSWLGKLVMPLVSAEATPSDAVEPAPVNLTGLASARDPSATGTPAR